MGLTGQSAQVGSIVLGRRGRMLLALASVALIVLLGIIQADQFRDDRRLRDRLEHSYAAESQLSRLLSLHQDMETGQRGYVLTGKGEFLQPYLDARAHSTEALSELRRLFRRDPALEHQRQTLEQLTAAKLAFSERVIALRERGSVHEATLLISGGQGKAIMDEVREIVGRLIASERRAVGELSGDAAASRLRVQGISFGIQILLLALLAAAFHAYLTNIRRLNAAKVQAADQSARQSAIFEAALDAMLVLDEEGCIEAANPAAERLFGTGALNGQPIAGLFAMQRKDRTIRALLQRLANGAASASQVQTFLGRRSDATTFDADVAISPVELADGRRYLVAIRDATERRRVERLKTEFVSTVSHELRTPLTSIAGSLGLVAAGATGPLEPRAARLIAIAHSNSQRLVRLINDILDIEKIESGKMTFDIRLLSLRETVQEAVQANLGYAAEAAVEIALAPGADDVQVTADHDRLIQVLTNLLSNAIKFSPPGAAVRVVISPGPERHRVTVSDCGPGIPDSFRENIFGKFAQADSSDTRSKGGTGLGLAIVKEILDRTGASIDFETSPHGTSFHVDLPSARPSSAGRSVLLVRVDDRLSSEIASSLERHGISVTAARNLPELSMAAEKRSFGAILIGLSDTGEDVSSLVRLIRSHPALRGTPILVSAGGHRDAGVSQALALLDWLDGPPSPADLQNRAELLLGSEEDAKPLTILHVEDDVDVLRVVMTAFGDRARIICARDATEARAVLARDTPDLVILDLALPGESGLQLLPDLESADGALIPVVIYTATDEDPDTSARVAAMLTKSKVDLEDLVTTVLRVIKGSGAVSA